MVDKEVEYFFISHSHLDIKKVRIIRNTIENISNMVCEPILFFLKSLSEETEIVELIKREIDARQWFIYCESTNAKKSKWVQSELKYIAKIQQQNHHPKNVLKINIDQYSIDNYEQIVELQRETIRQVLKSYVGLINLCGNDNKVSFEAKLKKYGYHVQDLTNTYINNNDDNINNESQNDMVGYYCIVIDTYELFNSISCEYANKLENIYKTLILKNKPVIFALIYGEIIEFKIYKNIKSFKSYIYHKRSIGKINTISCDCSSFDDMLDLYDRYYKK